MQRAPITWSAGKFDLDSLSNMGSDAIPTLFDASISGFLSEEFSSGIGSGNDIYLMDIDEVLISDMYEDGNHPSGNVWYPKVSTGHFYIDGNEYYLFACKGVTIDTPTSGRLDLGTFDYEYPPNAAPIILTSGASEFETEDQFGKTYEYTPFNSEQRTLNKFRRVTDLTGKKEWVNNDGITEEYVFNYSDMTFTFHSEPNGIQYDWYIICNPSGFEITAEYETSDDGFYIVSGVDLNPLNNISAQNCMLAIADSSVIEAKNVKINNSYRQVIGDDEKCIVMTHITSIDGSPLIGVDVEFTSGIGSFSPSTASTGKDGRAYTEYTMGDLDSDGVIVMAECNSVLSSGWIQFGKLS